MKKIWHSIWFNLLLDAVIIVTGIILFYYRINSIDSFNLSSGIIAIILILFLVLHCLYLLVIAIINLVKKNFLKAVFFFLQSVAVGWVIRYGALVLLFVNMPSMGFYTDEGDVNSSMTECEYSKIIADSTFYRLMRPLTQSRSNAMEVSEKALIRYNEEKANLTDTFSIARRGCRTYEDSVIVFRLLYSNENIYDVEIYKKRNNFCIIGFRPSQFMK